jgi:uncharacterized protein (TIGR02145 family)
MKKLYAFTLMLGLLWSVFPGLTAQNYQITFSGSGMSNVVQTVRVWNLTADTTFTMNGNDTLTLIRPSGIDQSTPIQRQLVVYPNPSDKGSSIAFHNVEPGDVTLELLDVSGKLITRHVEALPSGQHTFQIGETVAGIYIIQINTPSSTFSTKWISGGMSGSPAPRVTYTGRPAIPLITGKLSGINSVVQLNYTDGDQLMFRGVSGNYNTIVTAVPTQSMHIDFGFVACTDIDNNHYPVVVIGTQTWMASNLKVTKYNNGTSIPEVSDFNSWANTTTPAYCWYNNDPVKGATYGALYKWQTIDGGNLCPTGWRVPAVADWTALIIYLGGDTLAGGKIKETGTLHWDTLMPGTSNASGFTALPAGMRAVSGGTFQALGTTAYFWTSQDYSANFAHMRYVAHNSNTLSAAGNNKGNGFSVRCIRD